ncbi:MAG: hypothetical protein Q7W16_06825 [Coriobacteriia bacterium]|nr:hypothetical protein [Coriobacteriia bacterium]
MSDDVKDNADSSRFAVLDVFGLKLEVSNPRLAELLTMDAKDALVSDVRDLGTARAVQEFREEAAQAAPEMVLTPPTAKDEDDATARRQFRARAAALGQGIGFECTPDGVWRSDTGVSILSRAIERPVSLAAASHYVSELATRREQLAGPGASVLFIAESQQSADVFKVAIRQQHLYDLMRVISIANLDDIGRLYRVGGVDHAKAVILLSPAATIDVGEILSVIRAAGAE